MKPKQRPQRAVKKQSYGADYFNPDRFEWEDEQDEVQKPKVVRLKPSTHRISTDYYEQRLKPTGLERPLSAKTTPESLEDPDSTSRVKTVHPDSTTPFALPSQIPVAIGGTYHTSGVKAIRPDLGNLFMFSTQTPTSTAKTVHQDPTSPFRFLSQMPAAIGRTRSVPTEPLPTVKPVRSSVSEATETVAPNKITGKPRTSVPKNNVVKAVHEHHSTGRNHSPPTKSAPPLVEKPTSLEMASDRFDFASDSIHDESDSRLDLSSSEDEHNLDDNSTKYSDDDSDQELDGYDINPTHAKMVAWVSRASIRPLRYRC